MPPAARIGDMHTCPLVNPGPVPHVGGPITTGAPTVLIGGPPAARVGDMAVCTGPPDTIIRGSPTVIICGQMAARLGDNTAHGGVIVAGCPTVLIGDAGSGASSTVSGAVWPPSSPSSPPPAGLLGAIWGGITTVPTGWKLLGLMAKTGKTLWDFGGRQIPSLWNGVLHHQNPATILKTISQRTPFKKTVKSIGLSVAVDTLVAGAQNLGLLKQGLQAHDGLKVANYAGRVGYAFGKSVVASTVGHLAGKGGAILGAKAGAFVGSFIFPPVGTAAGAVVGAVAGYLIGSYVASKATEATIDYGVGGGDATKAEDNAGNAAEGLFKKVTGWFRGG